jgi:hypothetical protein
MTARWLRWIRSSTIRGSACRGWGPRRILPPGRDRGSGGRGARPPPVRPGPPAGPGAGRCAEPRLDEPRPRSPHPMGNAVARRAGCRGRDSRGLQTASCDVRGRADRGGLASAVPGQRGTGCPRGGPAPPRLEWRPNAPTPYCNRYSNAVRTSTEQREPARTSRPRDLRKQHGEERRRTDRLELGVKGSQVQILSARQRNRRSRAGRPDSGGPSSVLLRPGQGVAVVLDPSTA